MEVSPDTKETMLQLAVIGAGMWGPNLVRTLHGASGSALRWVADIDPDRLERLSGGLPGVRLTTDPGVVLADPEVDAIAIATPTSTHFELASAALRAGKHVLIEKPITADVAQAEALGALADERGLVLMVGHVFLYNPAVAAIRDLLDEGTLGDLHYVSMSRTNQGPVRPDVSAAWDLASHDISMTNWWFHGPPTSVTATGGAWVSDQRADAVFATLTYPGEVLVNLSVSWLEPGKLRAVRLVGSRAMLTFDDTRSDEKIRIYAKRTPDDCTRDIDLHVPLLPPGEPLRLQCDHFVHCIETGHAPLTNAAFSTEVARTIAAIEQSMANGGARTVL